MEFQLDQAREILGRTPVTLNSLLRDVPETWSPFDVVGHLIHAEQTDWIPRARIILEQGERGTFEPFDRFAMFEKFKGKSLSELLDRFEELREHSLKELELMN